MMGQLQDPTHVVPSIKALAKGIVDSAQRHEESYDKVAADAATAAADADSRCFVNYASYYKLTLWQACEPEGELAQPIYLLLMYAWNDALYWANEQLKKES